MTCDHPLLVLLDTLPEKPCTAARVWIATLPRDITPSEAWAACPEPEWKDWLVGMAALACLASIGWRTLVEKTAGLRDDVLPVVRQAQEEAAQAAAAARASAQRCAGFMGCLAGRCLDCDGLGCSTCERTGYRRPSRAAVLEKLHPADAWTLPQLWADLGRHSGALRFSATAPPGGIS
jgi:hypothetical protein